ncbi:hypothetical protein D3C78_1846920 [compost metagenome]
MSLGISVATVRTPVGTWAYPSPFLERTMKRTGLLETSLFGDVVHGQVYAA